MTEGLRVRVLRGRYNNKRGRVVGPHEEWPDFYWVDIDQWKHRNNDPAAPLEPAEPKRSLQHKDQLAEDQS
jgi:hypothetical protein